MIEAPIQVQYNKKYVYIWRFWKYHNLVKI